MENLASVVRKCAKSVVIAGVPVDTCGSEDYIEIVSDAIRRGEKLVVFYSNARVVTHVNYHQETAAKLYAQVADYVMCDGFSLEMCARIKSLPVPQKTAYNVWFWDFSRECASRGHRIFLLGGTTETVSRAAENLVRHAPGLQVDYHHGYFNKRINDQENCEVLEAINTSQSHILLVGFGVPAQENWVAENRDKLNVNAVFTCGDAFRYFAGENKVAPKWMRVYGLEWLYRLVKEPVRLLPRYIVEIPAFLFFGFFKKF